MSLGSGLIALARSKAGQWYYTNDDWARMNPEQSGGTDCSGFARWCYLQYGYDIGTWTGNESQAGYEIARGHYAWEIPWDIMQPGDLILMTATYWNLWDFSKYLCHIELYCGGGTMIGHPGGMGPQEKWAQAWMEAYGCITWMVRRVFESEDDEVSATDVWAYKTAYPNDMEIRTSNPDAYQMLYNASKQLTRTDTAGWDNPQGHDMFGRVQIIEKDVREIKSAIDGLKVGGATVDYDKLTDMVADKLAARLKD